MPAHSLMAGEAARGARRRGALGTRGGARWGKGAGCARRYCVRGSSARRGARAALCSARPPPDPGSGPRAPGLLAPAPPHSSSASAAAASVGATLGQPPLAALPPGPHSAPQEGEGRGAVAAARLTEPGGPLKGAAPWAQGGGPRRRLAH
nr:atherin-like [Chlorocebus sabaeus]